MAQEIQVSVSVRGWIKFYVTAEIVLAFALWREPVIRDWIVRRAVRLEMI